MGNQVEKHQLGTRSSNTPPKERLNYLGKSLRIDHVWCGCVWVADFDETHVSDIANTKSGLGVPSPFFPGILLFRKPSKTRKKRIRFLRRTMVDQNGPGIKPWTGWFSAFLRGLGGRHLQSGAVAMERRLEARAARLARSPLRGSAKERKGRKGRFWLVFVLGVALLLLFFF